MRHFPDGGVDPFEIRRWIGRVAVENLRVLDLTNPSVRRELGIGADDLIGDDYTETQAVAAAAVTAGFDGILAPSAALPGRRTLVVFAAGASHLIEEQSSVRQPPPRMADLLRVIRLHPDVPSTIRDLVAELIRRGSAAVRARRR